MGVIIKNNRMYTGGGGGYSEFTLWEDSSGASPSSAVTLADNISKYDAIYIVSASNAEPNYRNSQIIPVSAIDKTGSTNFGVFDTGANNYYYSVLNYVDDTHLTLGNWGSGYPIKYYKIVGIKYRGDAELHEYSETEHIVGTWIDGSTIYEKTFTGLSIPTDGYNWVHISSIDTTTWGEVLDCKIYRTMNNKYTAIPIAEYSGYASQINDLAISIVSSTFNTTITMAIVRYTKTTS